MPLQDKGPNGLIVKRLQKLPSQMFKLSTEKELLPALLRPFAGKNILPPSLVYAFVTTNVTGALRTLNIAVRTVVGIDRKNDEEGNYEKWMSSASRKKYVSDGAVAVGEPMKKLMESPTISEKWWNGDELRTIYVIVKGFDEHVLSFEEVKKNLRYDQPIGASVPRKVALAELLVQLIGWYTKRSSGMRHAILFTLLGAQDMRSIKQFKSKPTGSTVYVFQDGHKNDVSTALASLAKTMEIDSHKFRVLIRCIQDGTASKRGSDRTADEFLARELLDCMWLKLAQQGRVTARPKEFTKAVVQAIKDLNGRTKKLRETSGHYRPLTVAELKMVVHYLVDRIDAIASGQVSPNKATLVSLKSMAAAVSRVSAYERTPEQCKAALRNHRVPVLNAVIARGSDPSALWSPELLQRHGFVKDPNAAAGWRLSSSSPSDKLDNALADLGINAGDKSALVDNEEVERLRALAEEEKEDPLRGIIGVDGMIKDETDASSLFTDGGSAKSDAAATTSCDASSASTSAAQSSSSSSSSSSAGASSSSSAAGHGAPKATNTNPQVKHWPIFQPRPKKESLKGKEKMEVD
ncbi:hypothetical protein JCM10908_002456 [Rhodotorula pacifica]|uniref:uncharacterized protein n=1 Tax=Rhodotorula pacifica TaxID=1495444 RepID=UPI0031715D81